jgi:protein-tyrosine kinase
MHSSATVARPGFVSAAPGESHETISANWKAPVYEESMLFRINPNLVINNRGVCITDDSPVIEYYKILRTRIQQQAKSRKINTLMVTSPNRQEGKTVTCINMGFVFAREFSQTVLMVDCDFHGQDIHRYLGIQSEHSLIDYFLHGIPLNRLIIWPGIDKLTLISGSNTVRNSTELLSSEMMQALIAEMGSRYEDRYVFFDAPPVLERSEAITLAPMMDGIIMVVEAGRTSQMDIEKAVSLLPREKLLGFVLNKKQ